MGWKDLMKNVTDKATSVAETAQAKFEEQKQLSAIKKEEQNKKMEEMNERVTEYEQELLQNILSGFSGAPCIEVEDNILDFTKDYFEKLLLPANSVSASKITMYPYSDKIQKKAQKALREYDDTETPVFQFEGNKGEFILMTPTKLYIAVAFPENQTFVANVAVDLQQVSQLGFVSTEEGYQVVCNGVELFSADNVSEFDRITIEELQTERGYYTHHKTIIVVYKEWIDIATRESYEFQGIEPEPKMEGPLPTVWLEIKPGVSWFKYKESALMAVRAYRDVSGYESREAYNQLIRWGDERMIDILDSEIESFKRHAEERGLYKDAPEEFYRQIGLILVALKIVRKVYGIHTKKKELESFIFENVTVAWHTKVVDQCYEYPYEDSEEGDLF